MKFLFWILLLAVVAFVLGFKRARPGAPQREAAASPSSPVGPEAMMRCAECGTHLPASEALPGRGGQFCSAEHRTRFEARQG